MPSVLLVGSTSLADHLHTPLGFEPVAQALGTAKTVTVGKSATSVGKLPILDIVAEWAQEHIPQLEQTIMSSVPPPTISEDDIKAEDEYYTALTQCAFPGPNAAMTTLKVDARLSRRGPPGMVENILCILATGLHC